MEEIFGVLDLLNVNIQTLYTHSMSSMNGRNSRSSWKSCLGSQGEREKDAPSAGATEALNGPWVFQTWCFHHLLSNRWEKCQRPGGSLPQGLSVAHLTQCLCSCMKKTELRAFPGGAGNSHKFEGFRDPVRNEGMQLGGPFKNEKLHLM